MFYLGLLVCMFFVFPYVSTSIEVFFRRLRNIEGQLNAQRTGEDFEPEGLSVYEANILAHPIQSGWQALKLVAMLVAGIAVPIIGLLAVVFLLCWRAGF